MEWQFTPYTLPAAASTFVSAAFAWIVWRRRPKPVAGPLLALLLCMAVWAGGYTFELTAVSLSLKTLALKIKFIGIVPTSVAWLAFVLRYTRRQRWLTWHNLALLSLIPAATLLLVWTNEIHHLIWPELELVKGPLYTLHIAIGPWLTFFTIYAYLLYTVGFFLLANIYLPISPVYRDQIGLILAGALLIGGSHLAKLILFPSVGLSLTPLTFVFVAPLVGWSVLRCRLPNAVPVARDRIVENLDNPVIVLDPLGYVLDINPAAQTLTGCSAKEAGGLPIERVLPAVKELLPDEHTEAHTEITLGEGDAARHYKLYITPLREEENTFAGHLVLLHDITASQRTEQALQRRIDLERLITAISTKFLDLPADETETQIHNALQTIGEFVGVDQCRILQFDPHLTHATILYEWRATPSKRASSFMETIAVETIPAWWRKQFTECQKTYIADTATLPPDTAPPNPLFPLPDLKAVAAIALCNRDELLGVLTLEVLHEARTWAPESVTLLKIIGEIFAATLARKRAETALQRRNRDLALFNRAGQALTAILDLQEVLELLLQSVVTLIGAEGSSVWLWENERKEHLICKAVVHEGVAESLVGFKMPAGHGIVGRVGEDGESHIVNDTEKNAHFAPEVDAQTGFTTHSLLAVPLYIRGEILGVLEVVNKHQTNFTIEECDLVETLAASAAIAVENVRLIESLQQRNEELDAFAHTVAHDLKNPLSVVLTNATDLVEFGEMAESDREQLQYIAQSARRMVNIIDELLLLARVRKSEDIDCYPLDMHAIARQARYRLDDMIHEYDAQIVTAEDDWPLVDGYGPWVEEVWVNYLSNAIKYGGQPPRVEFGAEAVPDGMVRFWVQDNGAGLTEAEQARLFTPFTRLNQVDTRGHGLGLSIVKRIVEKLGGQVQVESSGQGSRFSFTLPSIED